MKQYFLKLLSVCAASFLLVSFSPAQNDKKTSSVAANYVISAKAGGVNFVFGNVAVTRKYGKSGYLLKGDSLAVGDKVSTETGSKAEVLLNPGSFVRLAENTEFEFKTTDLDDLQVKVNRGSAIFEVIADSEFKVTVDTPRSRFYIVKTGIYRVDADLEGNARIEVWKGKAQVEDGKGTVLKGGQTVEAASGLVAKFDRDEKDEFELWSKNRAKELDKINARLRSREMNRALMSSFSRNGFNLRNSYGFWVFDSFSRSYCFLPFGYGWSSPYGYWYDNTIWNYRLPRAIQYQIYSNVNPQMGGGQPAPPYPGNQPGSGTPAPPIGQPSNPAPSAPIQPSPGRGSWKTQKID